MGLIESQIMSELNRTADSEGSINQARTNRGEGGQGGQQERDLHNMVRCCTRVIDIPRIADGQCHGAFRPHLECNPQHTGTSKIYSSLSNPRVKSLAGAHSLGYDAIVDATPKPSL